jgi:hypothetical protein
VPVRFLSTSVAPAGPAIRLTEDLQRTASLQGTALAEAEARWRLVETAWLLDLPRAGMQYKPIRAEPALQEHAAREPDGRSCCLKWPSARSLLLLPH